MGSNPLKRQMDENSQNAEFNMKQSQYQSTIKINQLKVNVSPFSRQYQLFPEKDDFQDNQKEFKKEKQVIHNEQSVFIALSNIQIDMDPSSPQNTPLALLQILENDFYEDYNIRQCSEKRQTRSPQKSQKNKRKINMEMLESQF
ncbi:hypothetical protein pb186bvf_012284 [Paramecium bursaria]